MKALTLWRPWPAAIFFFSDKYWKDIENRPYRPPQSVIGQRIAIHAGKRLDKEAFDQWLEIMKPNILSTVVFLESWKEISEMEGIIGTVVIDSVCKPEETDSQWASGPVCLKLRDRRHLKAPIPCKGKQGYWNVPLEIEHLIKRREVQK